MVFVTFMVTGLVGLFVMAIPAFGRHGHAPPAAGHGPGLAHGGHAGHAREVVPADPSASAGVLRFLPSPRAIFSVLALYGAFGNALVEAAHLPVTTAALVAAIPALVVERLAVAPLWNLLFRFQGRPSAPLTELLFTEATAVTPFPNGRGVVSVVRDGRVVQLSARLRDDEAALPVKVGDRLRVEDVDVPRERLTVSALRSATHREESSPCQLP